MAPYEDSQTVDVPLEQGEMTSEPHSLDDPRVIRDVQEYGTALRERRAADREALLSRYPSLAEDLSKCLDALELVQHAVPQLHEPPTSSAAARLEAAAMTPPGTLGDYHILREIGRGGMGVVYLAEQLSLGRQVALKVLPFAAVLDPKHLQRFQNEARAAASLKHPNIVTVHAVGCERGVHYYAMEYVQGETLARTIRNLRDQSGLVPKADPEVAVPASQIARDLSSGRLGAPVEEAGSDAPTTDRGTELRESASASGDTERSPQAVISTDHSVRRREFFHSVARLGIQAAEALEHAHAMGVVHRDIKPSNLMIDASGHLWITDFGLAMTRSETNLTMSGDLLGTLRYMSPEQIQAKHGVLDHRTDVYSLGVTLYELLTLQPPFPSDDRQALMREIAEDEPRRPRQLNEAIPRDLETIILKATATEAGFRYATASALADDLRRFVEDKPIQARRPSPLVRAVKWSHRHRAVVWSAAVLLVMAVAGFVISAGVIARDRAAALKQEQSLRYRAEENVRLGLDTLNRLCITFAEKQFGRRGRITREERDYLKTALRFYEDFARANQDVDFVQHELGSGYRNVADICQILGMHHEAEQAYRKAIPVFKWLREHSNSDRKESPRRQVHSGGRVGVARAQMRVAPDYGLELAQCYEHLGWLLSERGKDDEAVDVLRQAVALYKELLAARPSNEFRYYLAKSHEPLGDALSHLGRLQDAESAHRESLALYEQLLDRSPAVGPYRRGLARSLSALGFVLQESAKLDEAEQTFRCSLALLQDLIDERPDIREYREEQARSHRGLAVVLRDAERPDDAEEAFQASIAIREKLAAQFPSVALNRFALAVSRQNLSGLYVDVGRDAEAKQIHARAIDDLETLVDQFPHSPRWRRELASYLTELCPIDELRAPERAARLLEDAEKLDADSADPQQNERPGEVRPAGGSENEK